MHYTNCPSPLVARSPRPNVGVNGHISLFLLLFQVSTFLLLALEDGERSILTTVFSSDIFSSSFPSSADVMRYKMSSVTFPNWCCSPICNYLKIILEGFFSRLVTFLYPSTQLHPQKERVMYINYFQIVSKKVFFIHTHP